MMKRTNTNDWLILLFASLAAIAGLAEAFGTSVVYGPVSELVLLTSKLAAKEGEESFCIVSPGSERTSRKFMYGKKDDDDDDKENEKDGDDKIFASVISSADDMQNALSKASTLFLMCYDNPIEEKSLSTLINVAGPDLSKVVMLSKMGATASGGGGFFGGGNKLLDSETTVRSVCKSKNLQFSVVRAGVLKGGGPGDPDWLDYGLHKTYYNNLFEFSEAACTMAHDRFSLGVDCTAGDTVKMPNAIMLLGMKAEFDAAPYDTNRINAAMACVMAAKHDKPVEFSIGCAKAEKPPSKEEWEEIMTKMEV